MASIKPDLTLIYKKVDHLEIPMDLYLPKNTINAPVLLWFHGGGLLQGCRDMIAPHMKNAVQTYGFACISADYRLAPQVEISEILEDVIDCVIFIRTRLSDCLGQGVVDASRLAISGSSAGGYLALLAALVLKSKPQVVAPIYPITDPLGTFFTKPQPLPVGSDSSEADLDLARLGFFLNPRSTVVANSSETSPRRHMYAYMLKTASLARLWGIFPGDEGAVAQWRIPRTIKMGDFPPTYLIHGMDDTAVGVEQTDEVAGAILGDRNPVVYERPNGEDHEFDQRERYENPELYEFIMRYLN
ncbi:hypothetical protein N7478_012981 [Penicillium angulare]|uniref:uncharacterized protein n=1 Tax=Penicillium angulare TaxID=116970 RepID=UPI0025419808|nr:uncharacterized protein N7478_012981 [Penicillium angulare]KAJ5256877.1 hypothetical protein N7478_012981 [Penicillium angulare]